MRRSLHESVQSIVEELQGSSVQQQPQGQIALKGSKNPAQQVANGVQQVANQAAATGDQKVQAQVDQQLAQQQGVDPKLAAQANKINQAQPRPPRMTASAQARDQRNDNLDGRKQAMQGQVVQAEAEEEPAEAGNPDEDEDFNENPAGDEAAKRAKAVFPDAKDPDATAYSTDGDDEGQHHHEITHPGQKVAELFSTEDRTNLLDEVFGA